MTETQPEDLVPAWVGLVDFLATESMRVHLRTELDLRAVFRSEGSPEDVLARAERVLFDGIDLAKRHLLTARAVLLVNKCSLGRESEVRVAELVAAMQMLLMSRVSGWACAVYFLREVREGRVEVNEFARVVTGLTPQVIDLESMVESLFPPAPGEGIDSA